MNIGSKKIDIRGIKKEETPTIIVRILRRYAVLIFCFLENSGKFIILSKS